MFSLPPIRRSQRCGSVGIWKRCLQDAEPRRCIVTPRAIVWRGVWGVSSVDQRCVDEAEQESSKAWHVENAKHMIHLRR